MAHYHDPVLAAVAEETLRLLTSNHPTLLHIPSKCLEAFDVTEPLHARVVGTQVYMAGTLH